MAKILLSLLLLVAINANSATSSILQGENFTLSDSVLVTRDDGHTVFSWQPEKMLVPASLSKLATAYLAIDKWGLDHRFITDFFVEGATLWVKGQGDPFIVSEEMDLMTSALKSRIDLSKIKAISVDASYFDLSEVPGRSRVNDPYNAPLSAVSANFNTVKLRKVNGQLKSAEPQTPLTNTARRVASILSKVAASSKGERVNLGNDVNAQTNFAELLGLKLGLVDPSISINQELSTNVKHLYQHANSHTLADVLRGTLEYSNNFMANQLFLQLADSPPLTFPKAQAHAGKVLHDKLGFKQHVLREGSGLSRDNRLSASQLNLLLEKLKANQELFKLSKNPLAKVRAKTGTLDGVRSYAGYINFDAVSYRFVFMFNRKVAWRYREQLLDRLVIQLSKLAKSNSKINGVTP